MLTAFSTSMFFTGLLANKLFWGVDERILIIPRAIALIGCFGSVFCAGYFVVKGVWL